MLVLDGRIVLAEFISVILFTIKLCSENMGITKMKSFRKMVSSLVEIATDHRKGARSALLGPQYHKVGLEGSESGSTQRPPLNPLMHIISLQVLWNLATITLQRSQKPRRQAIIVALYNLPLTSFAVAATLRLSLHLTASCQTSVFTTSVVEFSSSTALDLAVTDGSRVVVLSVMIIELVHGCIRIVYFTRRRPLTLTR
uniref:Uncharacterized protein n=1 Tax=Timema tahoe TaxID=61484 RepID=A0A7R9ID89_9NEOP|nr:unnamed protein product [Timema tahoe]